jgi:hypothetical protein
MHLVHKNRPGIQGVMQASAIGCHMQGVIPYMIT